MIRFAIPFVALLASVAPAKADIVYASLEFREELVAFDTSTSAESVVTLSNPIIGLAIQPGTNTLYAFSSFPFSQGSQGGIVPQLSTVDPVTGLVTPIGGDLTGFQFLAFDQQGDLYVADDNSVYPINPLTGNYGFPVAVTTNTIEAFTPGPDRRTFFIVDSGTPTQLQLISAVTGNQLNFSGPLPCAIGDPVPLAVFYSAPESQLFCNAPNYLYYETVTSNPVSISPPSSNGSGLTGGVDVGAATATYPMYVDTFAPDIVEEDTAAPEPATASLALIGLVLAGCCFRGARRRMGPG